MGYQIRGNNKGKNCSKEFANDCFDTLYDTSIMIDNRISQNNIEDNRDAYRDLSIEQRELIVDSMSDIMEHDQKLDKIEDII